MNVLRNKIELPIWLVTTVLPLLFSLLVTLTVFVARNSNFSGVIETSMINVQNRLDRIETKLDHHIELEYENLQIYQKSHE